MTTIGALFPNPNYAEGAVSSLIQAGVPSNSTRIIDTTEGLGRCLGEKGEGMFNWKLVGVATLASAAVFGLVGGLAVIDNVRFGITGIPAAVAIWLVFVIIGIMVGAFLGIWIGYNDCDCTTEYYAEGIDTGGAVVVVEAAGGQASTVLRVLEDSEGAELKVCGGYGGGH